PRRKVVMLTEKSIGTEIGRVKTADLEYEELKKRLRLRIRRTRRLTAQRSVSQPRRPTQGSVPPTEPSDSSGFAAVSWHVFSIWLASLVPSKRTQRKLRAWDTIVSGNPGWCAGHAYYYSCCGIDFIGTIVCPLNENRPRLRCESCGDCERRPGRHDPSIG